MIFILCIIVVKNHIVWRADEKCYILLLFHEITFIWILSKILRILWVKVMGLNSEQLKMSRSPICKFIHDITSGEWQNTFWAIQIFMELIFYLICYSNFQSHLPLNLFTEFSRNYFHPTKLEEKFLFLASLVYKVFIKNKEKRGYIHKKKKEDIYISVLQK
jgi:hypothetical protein